MFKNYLRIFPKGIQLSIFLGLWVALFMIGSFMGNILQTQVFGITTTDGIKTMPAQVTMTLNVLLQVFMFALPALLFSYLADPDIKRYIGFRKNGKRLNVFVLLLLAGLIIYFVSSLAGLIRTINLGSIAEEMQAARNNQVNAYLQNSSWTGVLQALVLMALIPAICEELFFRGLFMKFMLNYNHKPWMAFLFTSLFFALLHASVYEFIPICAASMILCALYYYTGHLGNNIVVHFLVNAIQILMVVFASTDIEIASSLQDKLFLLGIFVTTGVGLYLVMQSLYKTRVEHFPDWNLQFIKHVQ